MKLATLVSRKAYWTGWKTALREIQFGTASHQMYHQRYPHIVANSLDGESVGWDAGYLAAIAQWRLGATIEEMRRKEWSGDIGMGFGSVTDLYFVLQLINKTYPLPIRPDPRKSLFETRFPNPCTERYALFAVGEDYEMS